MARKIIVGRAAGMNLEMDWDQVREVELKSAAMKKLKAHPIVTDVEDYGRDSGWFVHLKKGWCSIHAGNRGEHSSQCCLHSLSVPSARAGLESLSTDIEPCDCEGCKSGI